MSKVKVTMGKKRKTAESSPLTMHCKRAPYAVRCKQRQAAVDNTIPSPPEGDAVTAVHADGGWRAVYIW